MHYGYPFHFMRLLSVFFCAVVTASCSSSAEPPAPPSAVTADSEVHPLNGYAAIYSFTGAPDGAKPYASLVAFHGALYGTTSSGGTGCQDRGCGTVFEIAADGTERVLHRFHQDPDGAEPMAALIAVDQTLYGTTQGGGSHCEPGKPRSQCGTVFAISASGKETVLYRFHAEPDGSNPASPLTFADGTLYGTTYYGGTGCTTSHGCGTVFELDTSGKERVLYRFSGAPDGQNPSGNLVFLNGKLYGTTFTGGTIGAGTVFELSLSGTERVLYSPQGFNDASQPDGLTAYKGVLYGAAYNGGRKGGDGAVFAVTTAGAEHIVYSFGGGSRGSTPYGPPVVVKGTLYGETLDGGDFYGCSGGCGIVYEINAQHKERALYRFHGPPDGAGPIGGLLYRQGMLFGTTIAGGSVCERYGCRDGYGTVFRLSP
jgi:uncharacterized repeat protein (TIGR03803 family)